MDGGRERIERNFRSAERADVQREDIKITPALKDGIVVIRQI